LVTGSSPFLRILALQLLVEYPDDGPVEACDVRAVVRGGDHVHERACDRVVAGPPLDRDVDVERAFHLGRRHVPAVVEHRDGLGESAFAGQPDHVGDFFAGDQVLAELADAAVEAKLGLPRLGSLGAVAIAGAGVRGLANVGPDSDRQSRHQVCGLPGPLDESVVVEGGVAQEHLPVRPEPYPGAGLGLRHPGYLAQPGSLGELGARAVAAELPGHAAPEARRPGVPFPVHLDVQPGGQRVDNARPDPVQAAGGGIRATAELPARVQPCHDQFDAAQLGLALGVHRNAAAVVTHLGGPVRVQHDLDPGAEPAERLVNGVVEDLP